MVAEFLLIGERLLVFVVRCIISIVCWQVLCGAFGSWVPRGVGMGPPVLFYSGREVCFRRQSNLFADTTFDF